MDDDARLVARTLAGDNTAFAQLYEKLWNDLSLAVDSGKTAETTT